MICMCFVGPTHGALFVFFSTITGSRSSRRLCRPSFSCLLSLSRPPLFKHYQIPAFIIQAYGAVLAPINYPAPSAQTDAPQGNLSRTLGSVVGTACLRAETRVGPPLTSHVLGLLKARGGDEARSAEGR